MRATAMLSTTCRPIGLLVRRLASNEPDKPDQPERDRKRANSNFSLSFLSPISILSFSRVHRPLSLFAFLLLPDRLVGQSKFKQASPTEPLRVVTNNKTSCLKTVSFLSFVVSLSMPAWLALVLFSSSGHELKATPPPLAGSKGFFSLCDSLNSQLLAEQAKQT